MWQAPGSVIPGVTGNPLIGNYYGLDIYDDSSANDWDIDLADADCGYGVTQVTDGMRMAGRDQARRDGAALQQPASGRRSTTPPTSPPACGSCRTSGTRPAAPA